MSLSIRSPDELIAALPHLLGFKPDESLIFVPLRNDLPLARIDFPATARDCQSAWDIVGDALQRHARPGAQMVIVCVTADRRLASAVSRHFDDLLAMIGISTAMRLWADDRQFCDLATGHVYLQSDAARTRISAASVLEGHAPPADSRAELAASLVGNREPIAALLSATRSAIRHSSAHAQTRWAEHRLRQFHLDGLRLTDKDAARLLVSLQATPTRERMCDDLDRGSLRSHLTMWSDLTRRAPDEVRATPASLLGLASWFNGNGALAWCALEQIPSGEPLRLAELVADALQRGLSPRGWETAKARARDHDAGINAGPSPFVRRSNPGPEPPGNGI